jgi:hypothetical protein
VCVCGCLFFHSLFTFRSQYAKNISDFTKPQNINSGVMCLNDMITNAMQHCCDVIDYLDQIKGVLIASVLILTIRPFHFPFLCYSSNNGNCHPL